MRDSDERDNVEVEGEELQVSEFDIGDRVVCNAPGSWVHGKTATVEALDVASTDGINGHRLKVDGTSGYTVVPPAEMAAIPDLAAAHNQAADLVGQAAELVRRAAIVLSGTAWSSILSDVASDLRTNERDVRDYDSTSD